MQALSFERVRTACQFFCAPTLLFSIVRSRKLRWPMHCGWLRKSTLSLATILMVAPSSSYAIPAFSRLYGTSCTTCHLDFPKLNDFGKAFKDAGFKFPKDDESFLKVPPIMLGAPAQAELWPKTVYPGTIPGILPVGLRYNTYFQKVSSNRNNFNLAASPWHGRQLHPRDGLSTGLFQHLLGGKLRQRHSLLGR